MNPLTEEFKEAEQIDANIKREKFVNTLSDEDKNKFKAVQEAVEILVKADVIFYLFPLLKTEEYPSKEVVWQWNSILQSMKYDNSGKPTKASMEKNGEFHEAFWSRIFNMHGFSWNTDYITTLNKIPRFYDYCIRKNQAYLKDEVFNE